MVLRISKMTATSGFLSAPNSFSAVAPPRAPLAELAGLRGLLLRGGKRGEGERRVRQRHVTGDRPLSQIPGSAPGKYSYYFAIGLLYFYYRVYIKLQMPT